MDSKSPEPYMLTVLTGPNAGAQVGVGKRRVSLGGEADADIILDHMGGEKVDLSFSKNRIRIKTKRPGVIVNGDLGMPVLDSAIAVLPAKIQLDPSIQIYVCQSPGTRKPVVARSATAILAILLVGVVGGGLLFGTKDTARAAVVAAETSQEFADMKSATAVPATHEEPPAKQETARLTPEDASEAFSKMAENAGLFGLTVVANGGAVRVMGYYSPEQLVAWQELRGEYDAKWGQKVPLLVDVSTKTAEPPLAIASIWLGEHPEVVTREGDVLALGSETKTGWRLTDIQQNSVLLVKGDQHATIDF